MLLFWSKIRSIFYFRSLSGAQGCIGPDSSTHRMHLAGDKVAVLCQHVRHHERRQLSVGVGVDEPIVWQRVTEVACRVMLHQVKKMWLRVVGWSDWGDFVVFIPGSISTWGATTSAASPTTTCLACVALRGGTDTRGNEVSNFKWKYEYF